MNEASFWTKSLGRPLLQQEGPGFVHFVFNGASPDGGPTGTSFSPPTWRNGFRPGISRMIVPVLTGRKLRRCASGVCIVNAQHQQAGGASFGASGASTAKTNGQSRLRAGQFKTCYRATSSVRLASALAWPA